MTAPYYPGSNPSAAGSFLEGAMSGVQAGYGFRTHQQDRMRARAKEDEDTAAERARRLREAVGFELSQKVQNANLARLQREEADSLRSIETEADRRTRLREAATRIRARYGNDPKYQGLTLLPDEELVQQFGGLVANPQRDRDAETARAESRQDLSVLNTQVDDARAELSREERGAPVRPMMADYDPAAAARFTADSTSAAGRITQLRRYMGNLLVSRDSTAAVSRGGRFDPEQGNILRRLYGVTLGASRAGSSAGASAKTPEDRWEELVDQGLSSQDAERRVREEFGLSVMSPAPVRR